MIPTMEQVSRPKMIQSTGTTGGTLRKIAATFPPRIPSATPITPPTSHSTIAPMINCVIVFRLVGRLDEDENAAPGVYETVQAGGNGNDRGIVLIAAEHCALRFQHADYRVTDAAELDAFTAAGAERKQWLRQRAAQQAY